MSDETIIEDGKTDDLNLGNNDDASVDADTSSADSKGSSGSDSVDQKEYQALKKKFYEVSAENKKFREKASASSKEAAEAKKLAADALKKIDQSNSLSEKRLINAELKILAAKEGLIDSDAFKMVDTSSVKVSENGDVLGADTLMADLKKNKPYLFKSNSSSSNEKTPSPEENATKINYMDMSDAEYAKAHPADWRR